MNRPWKGSRFCIVVCSPGPVAAAIYRDVGGVTMRLRVWTSGSRPAWMRRASLNVRTLLVDQSLPTLVTNARPRNVRPGSVGSAATSVSVSTDTFEATLHERGMRSVFAMALEEGLVADEMTSLVAVETALFCRNAPESDSARLSFHKDSAMLVSRVAGKLSARAFTLPGGQAELDTTLRLLPSCTLQMDGLCEDPEADWTPAGHLTVQDSRTCDRDACLTRLLDRTADLWTNRDRLPTFRAPKSRIRNAALRWCRPVEAALVLLCLAAIPPVRNASVALRSEQATLEQLQHRYSEAKSRTGKNAPRMASIEELSRQLHHLQDNAEDTLRTLTSLIDTQDSLSGNASINLNAVQVEDCGKQVSVSGTVAQGNEKCLTEFINTMGQRHFGQASDVTMHEQGNAIAFTVRLRRAPE